MGPEVVHSGQLSWIVGPDPDFPSAYLGMQLPEYAHFILDESIGSGMAEWRDMAADGACPRRLLTSEMSLQYASAVGITSLCPHVNIRASNPSVLKLSASISYK